MKLVDRLKQLTSVTGTGTVTLTGAVTGYMTLAQAMSAGLLAVGDEIPMCLEAGASWELSLYVIDTPLQLTRVRVIRSWTGTDPVLFPTGPKEIFCTPPSEYLNGQDLKDVPAVGNLETGDVVLLYRPGSKTLHTYLASNLGGGTLPVDTQAPTLSSPTGAPTGTTTYSGSVTTNEANGTLRYLATVNATETVATVKANGASLAITSTGSKAVTGSGLTQLTQYYLHFVHTDDSGNDSARVTSAPFTTAAAGDTTAPQLISPTATKTGSTTASGTVSTNEANGTLYRYASTNAVETAATVKAANLTQNVTASGVQNVSFTGLPSGATLYPHYLHRDAAGNDSTVASGGSFVTDSGNTAPAAPTIGTAVAGNGYVDVYFTLNSNGGSAITVVTATLSTGETATGTTSPIRVTASNGTARTASVTATNNVGTSPASAQSNSVTPAAPVAPPYTSRTTTSGGSAISGATFSPTAGATWTNSTGESYASGGTAIRVQVLDGSGNAAPNVKFVWAKVDANGNPIRPVGVSYSSTELPVGATGNNTARANGIATGNRYGSWTAGGATSQQYYGVFGISGALYAWASQTGLTAQSRCLAIFIEGYDEPIYHTNGTGTPLLFNIAMP